MILEWIDFGARRTQAVKLATTTTTAASGHSQTR